MRVLVFGAAGQIGREVCRAPWPASFEVLALDRNAADITAPATIGSAIARERPGLVINLAAYTAVDRAESEPEAAWAVNCAGAAHIAASCGEYGTPLIHLSTDYVFDGRKRGCRPHDHGFHGWRGQRQERVQLESSRRVRERAIDLHRIRTQEHEVGPHSANCARDWKRRLPSRRQFASQQFSTSRASVNFHGTRFS